MCICQGQMHMWHSQKEGALFVNISMKAEIYVALLSQPGSLTGLCDLPNFNRNDFERVFLFVREYATILRCSNYSDPVCLGKTNIRQVGFSEAWRIIVCISYNMVLGVQNFNFVSSVKGGGHISNFCGFFLVHNI